MAGKEQLAVFAALAVCFCGKTPAPVPDTVKRFSWKPRGDGFIFAHEMSLRTLEDVK